MLTVAPDPPAGDDRPADGSSSLIDEIVREGARRMLAGALQAEMDAYITRFAGERDENGHHLVVRNGSREPREVLTSAGAVRVTVPSSAVSASSSSSAPSPPATTSATSCTRPPSTSPRSGSGYEIPSHDLRDTA